MSYGLYLKKILNLWSNVFFILQVYRDGRGHILIILEYCNAKFCISAFAMTGYQSEQESTTTCSTKAKARQPVENMKEKLDETEFHSLKKWIANGRHEGEIILETVDGEVFIKLTILQSVVCYLDHIVVIST